MIRTLLLLLPLLSAADDDDNDAAAACSDCGQVRCVGGCTNTRRFR